MKQLILDLIPPPIPSFDNFVPGRNAEALFSLVNNGSKSSTGAAFEPIFPVGDVKNNHQVLYFWGESGSGKTHLLSALKSIKNTIFLTPRELEAGMPDAKVGEMPATSHYVLDNVEQLTDAQQINLFNLINLVHTWNVTQRNVSSESASATASASASASAPAPELASASAPVSVRIIVAGNVAPRDLPLRPELTSRLGSGLVFQLHPLSDTEKAAALRAHARTRSFTLRDEVIAYLLRHARRDMASLIAMLDALDAHSLETGREITLPLLRQMLLPSLQSAMQPAPQTMHPQPTCPTV